MRPHLRSKPNRSLPVGISALAASLTLFATGIAAPAHAEEKVGGDLDRWVPSFSFYFDVSQQKGDGSVETSPVLGPPLDFDEELDEQFPGTGCALRNSPTSPINARSGFLCPSARGTAVFVDTPNVGADTNAVPMVGATLELMTPRLIRGLLDPRLFVHGDGALTFGFERNLAGTGNPGEFSVPLTEQTRNDIEELSIPGQGSRARWQLGEYLYSAGGGVALSFTLFQRTLRIKPSFEWVQVEQDFIGVTRRAVKLVLPTGTKDFPATGPFNQLSAFREISLNRVVTKTFDGIGPGLELEVDTARLGPIMTSVYAAGRAYRLIGTLDQTLTATNEFGESATWTFEPERWMYRAGVGIRFRWSPESD
jgi:hypothetical protein